MKSLQNGRYAVFKGLKKSWTIDVAEAFLLRIQAATNLINKTKRIEFKIGSLYAKAWKSYTRSKAINAAVNAIKPCVLLCSPMHRFKGNAHGILPVNRFVYDFFLNIHPTPPYSILSQIILQDVLHFERSDMAMIMKMHVHLVLENTIAREYRKSDHITLEDIKHVVRKDHGPSQDFIATSSCQLMGLNSGKISPVSIDWVNNQWK